MTKHGPAGTDGSTEFVPSIDEYIESVNNAIIEDDTEGLISFLKTTTSINDLIVTLKVIREFKKCESKREWLMPFIQWVRLEQLEDYLCLLTGVDANRVTDQKALDYFKTINSSTKLTTGLVLLYNDYPVVRQDYSFKFDVYSVVTLTTKTSESGKINIKINDKYVFYEWNIESDSTERFSEELISSGDIFTFTLLSGHARVTVTTKALGKYSPESKETSHEQEPYRSRFRTFKSSWL